MSGIQCHARVTNWMSYITKVPIVEALEVIGRRLEEPEAEERNTTLSAPSIKRLLHL